jgi:hypothetical protein
MHPFAAKTAAFSGWLLARYSLLSMRPDRVNAPGIDGWPTPAIVTAQFNCRSAAVIPLRPDASLSAATPA